MRDVDAAAYARDDDDDTVVVREDVDALVDDEFAEGALLLPFVLFVRSFANVTLGTSIPGMFCSSPIQT